MGDVSPEKPMWNEGCQLDKKQERDCSIFGVRIGIWNMHIGPEYGGCDEPHSFVMKESAESGLEQQSGKLFSECSANDPCNECPDYSVLRDVTVPNEGVSRRSDRDASPDQMDQEGKVPKAEVHPEFNGLVTIIDDINKRQNDWISKDD